MQTSTGEPIMIAQRLAGIATVLVGLFALYHCVQFLQSLWDTPSRNLGIGSTVGSVVMIAVGILIAIPDRLPRNVAAIGMLLLGLCSSLLGVSILIWILFNAFVARQPEYIAGPPALAGAMIAVGIGFVSKAYSKLRTA